jgi:hypothetical protein
VASPPAEKVAPEQLAVIEALSFVTDAVIDK